MHRHLNAQERVRFDVARDDELVDLISIAREPLVRYISRYSGGNFDDATDIVHDTFVKLLEASRRDCELRVTVGWLFTAARRRCIDVARSRRRESARVERSADRRTATPDLSDDLVARLMFDQVLNGLSLAERRALQLHSFDDHPIAETAVSLGRSPEATMSLLARSRRKLRTDLCRLDEYHGSIDQCPATAGGC